MIEDDDFFTGMCAKFWFSAIIYAKVIALGQALNYLRMLVLKWVRLV